MHADVQPEILVPKIVDEFDGGVTIYGMNYGRKWVVYGKDIKEAKRKANLAVEKILVELSNHVQPFRGI
jgi:hypothetical protein